MVVKGSVGKRWRSFSVSEGQISPRRVPSLPDLTSPTLRAPPMSLMMPLPPRPWSLLAHAIAFLPEAPDASRAFVDALSRSQRARLLWEAREQGLEALIAATGAAGCDVEPTLTRVMRFQFARHLHATEELAARLADAGIDVILLKGSPLAARLYDAPPIEPWMRPVGDIDLFVAPNAVDRAIDVLRQAGLHLIDDPRTRHGGVKHSVDFRGTEGRLNGLLVELHARLSHSPWRENLEFGPLFERARPWERSGVAANHRLRVLDPLDEIAFLASHGAGHRFEALKWLLDLRLSLGQLADIDAALVWQRAGDCRCEQALRIGLWAIGQWLGESGVRLGSGGPNLSTARRALYGAALGMGPGLRRLRGLVTCLLLVDRARPSMVRPLVALGLERLRHG